MLFGYNQSNISYLGFPKNVISLDNKVSSFEDILDILISLCKINTSINSKIVCLDVNEISFSRDFIESPNSIDEEDSKISDMIDELNSIIIRNEIRILFYIGKNYFLGSQIDSVKKETIAILEIISSVMNIIGISYPSILVRIGSAYGNRKKTMSDFCDSLKCLKPETVNLLSVMNDDKPSLFSVTDLLGGIYYNTGIPICFRTLAHQFNDGSLSIREAMFLSASTWKSEYKPFIIHSESCDLDSNGISLSPNPSDRITRRIPTFGLNCDVIIDSPAKEICYRDYILSQKGLPPTVINKIGKK
jgi:hypothetical protein